MKREGRRTVTEWYDKLSDGYDELYHEEQARKHERILQLIGGERFNVVVDVGCGTGVLLSKISQMGSYLVGVDLSQRMLRKAKRRVEPDRTDLVRADCAYLPIRTGTADCALAISVIEPDANGRGVTSEIKRVLTTKGVMVLSFFHAENRGVGPADFGLTKTVYFSEVSRREALCLARGNRTSPDMGRHTSRG